MPPTAQVDPEVTWPFGPAPQCDPESGWPRPAAPGRSARWTASLVLLAAGWTALATGAVSSTVIRDHTDSCGQPANMPSSSGAAWGLLAAVIAVASIGVAISAWRRAGWHRALPVILGGAFLVGAGLLLIGWVALSHFQICF